MSGTDGRRQQFRNAMAQLAAAVNIITTAGPAGRGGFTASAVCSVTDDPPTLLVCMHRSSAQHALFVANSVLCVNTLAAGHQNLSTVFAGVPAMSITERFGLTDWESLATGAPVLPSALASFDCRIVETVDKGTHSVFFAEVLAMKRNPERAHGLVYFSRRYHQVGLSTG
ncbi:MAG TPA: flavin reductase [Candidatus Saccharimonadales bacterium]|nr:flavin reductase [Candidatus Saccharimonadales bacterium]